MADRAHGALGGVEAIKTHGGKGIFLVLGIDNVIARSWLRRRKGADAISNLILSEVPQGYTYSTVFLYSEDNIGDCASRFVKFDPNDPDIRFRHQASLQLLQGSHMYLNMVSEPDTSSAARNAQISVETLGQLELDRVRRRRSRWTCRPTRDDLVDVAALGADEVFFGDCAVEESDGESDSDTEADHSTRMKRSRPTS